MVAPLWAVTTRAPWGNQWRLAVLSAFVNPLRAVHHAAARPTPPPAPQTASGPASPDPAIRLEELTREVDRLRRLLRLKQTQDHPTVAARVIGRDATPWFRTLLLDVGRTAGVMEGAAALASDGLAGQVVEVGPAAARVALVTDPRFRMAALVQRSRAQGLVVGTARGRCYLAYLASADAAQPKDVVLTAGDGALVPKGLVIGEVIRVEQDSSGLWWQALVKPIVEAGTLEEVLCVQP